MTDEELDYHTKRMEFEKDLRDSQEPRMVQSKEEGYAIMVILFVIFVVYPIAKYFEA